MLCVDAHRGLIKLESRVEQITGVEASQASHSIVLHMPMQFDLHFNIEGKVQFLSLLGLVWKVCAHANPHNVSVATGQITNKARLNVEYHVKPSLLKFVVGKSERKGNYEYVAAARRHDQETRSLAHKARFDEERVMELTRKRLAAEEAAAGGGGGGGWYWQQRCQGEEGGGWKSKDPTQEPEK
jgi:hypothetical protein